MEGKRGRGKRRQKLMNWMMEDGYGKLKDKAQHREVSVVGDLDLPVYAGDLKKKKENIHQSIFWLGLL